MNIQAINFFKNQNFTSAIKNKNITNDEVFQISNKELATSQEIANLKVQANNVLKSANEVKETAKFAHNEASGVLYDSKIYQKQAQKIYQEVQDRIEMMEFEGEHVEDYVSVIMDLSEGEELFDVVIKDDKITAYKAQSKDSTTFDKYEIDLKTGELLTYKKDCHLYLKDAVLKLGYAYVADRMTSQYDAKEEYTYANGELISCDLDVSNKDFKRINKRYGFSNGALVNATFGIAEKEGANKKLQAARRFAFINDKLMAYYRNYELQSRLGTRSAEIVYEFDKDEDLASFSKGFNQSSMATWSNTISYKFIEEKPAYIIIGEKKNGYGESFSKKYIFEGDEVIIERR